MTRGAISTRGRAVALILAATLGATVGVYALVGDDGAGSRNRDSAAVLRQSVRRITQTVRQTLTYDVRLQVATSDDRADAMVTDLTVEAAADEPSTLNTGTVQLTAGTGVRQLHFLSQGRRLFLAGEEATGADDWQEVDLLEALKGGDGDAQLLALAVQRPTAIAALLMGVVEAEDIGPETVVDGVAANRYRARISFDSARRNVDASVDPEVFEVITQRIDGDEVDLDAWVDGNRRLRSIALNGTLDGGREYSLTVDFRSFNQRVPTSLPSATTVVGIADLDAILAAPIR